MMSSNFRPVSPQGLSAKHVKAMASGDASTSVHQQFRCSPGGQIPSQLSSTVTQLLGPNSQVKSRSQKVVQSTQRPTSSDACATITQYLMMYHTVIIVLWVWVEYWTSSITVVIRIRKYLVSSLNISRKVICFFPNKSCCSVLEKPVLPDVVDPCPYGGMLKFINIHMNQFATSYNV